MNTQYMDSGRPLDQLALEWPEEEILRLAVKKLENCRDDLRITVLHLKLTEDALRGLSEGLQEVMHVMQIRSSPKTTPTRF